MHILFDIIDILCLITKMILMIYSCWKFLNGNKEKNSTLFYGILFVATLM